MRASYSVLLGCCVALLVSSATPAGELFINLGRGPVVVHVPDSYDPEVPTPLVMLLHGNGGTGVGYEEYLRFLPLHEEFGFLYMHPDGTRDSNGNQFWNATDACCDFEDTEVDDSGYLRSLIEELQTIANVDEKMIFVVGHSNGGFMTERMACDHADLIAAAANFAGSSWFDESNCVPTEPVHSLRIHGSFDFIISPDGGAIKAEPEPGVTTFYPYPGALESCIEWATRNGCALAVDTSEPNKDLDWLVPGAETAVYKVEQECRPGGTVELWAMQGSLHAPFVKPAFSRSIVEYFYAHPKP